MDFNLIITDSDFTGVAEEEFKVWLGPVRVDLLTNAAEKQIYKNQQTLDIQIFKDIWTMSTRDILTQDDDSETLFKVFIEYSILFYVNATTEVLGEFYSILLDDDDKGVALATNIMNLFEDVTSLIDEYIGTENEPLPYHWVDEIDKLIILKEDNANTRG